MALLFLPIALRACAHLYDWAHADVVAADPILQHKAAYLNVPFFLGRAAFYFAVWIGSCAFLLNGGRPSRIAPATRPLADSMHAAVAAAGCWSSA